MKLILVFGILAGLFMVNKAQYEDDGSFEIDVPSEPSEPSYSESEVLYEVHSAFCDKVEESISSQICVKPWLIFWFQLCIYECNSQGDVQIKQCCDDADGDAQKYAMCSDLQCVISSEKIWNES